MIKGIAFDLEGTLIDVELAHHRAHIAIASELGLQLTIEEAISIIPSFVGGPDTQVLREISEKADFRGPLSDILERKRKYYYEFLEAIPIRPRPGVVPVLDGARKLGLLMAIGSVTPRMEGLRLLRTASLSVYFQETALVFSEDIQEAKPQPDVYRKTASRMKISPLEQLVFEDSLQGVKAAVAASSIVVAVPTVASREFADSLFVAGARRVVGNWHEINLHTLLSELDFHAGPKACPL
jgi:HAD superfamily hydrolase (TIGR01509 family)